MNRVLPGLLHLPVGVQHRAKHVVAGQGVGNLAASGQ